MPTEMHGRFVEERRPCVMALIPRSVLLVAGAATTRWVRSGLMNIMQHLLGGRRGGGVALAGVVTVLLPSALWAGVAGADPGATGAAGGAASVAAAITRVSVTSSGGQALDGDNTESSISAD